MSGVAAGPSEQADKPDLGCIACRRGQFRRGPPCTWCGGTGAISLSPSERLVFMRLRAYYIRNGREQPDMAAQSDVKGQGHRTSLRSSKGWRRDGAWERPELSSPTYLLGYACEGLTASDMVEFVRTVCWLEDRGL